MSELFSIMCRMTRVLNTAIHVLPKPHFTAGNDRTTIDKDRTTINDGFMGVNSTVLFNLKTGARAFNAIEYCD